MIKALIFDLGDVIVKVDRTKQFRKFAAKGNKTFSYIKYYFENYSLGKSFGEGKLSSKQFYNIVSKDLNLRMSFDEFKKVWCNVFSLNGDVAELIKNLKRNFKLILLSNTDTLHFGYIKKKFKIINAFDDYVLSYKVGYMKPNPLIFLNAIKKAKTLPFNCVYIDDIPEFVYVARSMGIMAFQYKNFEKLMGDLSKVKVLTKVL